MQRVWTTETTAAVAESRVSYVIVNETGDAKTRKLAHISSKKTLLLLLGRCFKWGRLFFSE
jgi:hypothetical protein